MPPSFLDTSSECYFPLVGSWKREQKFKFCDILCHIVPDLILYFEILRIHCNVQITNIVFSFQNQDVKINKGFWKTENNAIGKEHKVMCIFKTLL